MAQVAQCGRFLFSRMEAGAPQNTTHCPRQDLPGSPGLQLGTHLGWAGPHPHPAPLVPTACSRRGSPLHPCQGLLEEGRGERLSPQGWAWQGHLGGGRVPWALTCLQCLAGHAPAPHHLGKPQVSINHALGHVGKRWASPKPCWLPACPWDAFVGWSSALVIVPSLRGAKEKCSQCLQKQKFALSCSRWDQRGTAGGTSTLSLVPAPLAHPLPRPESAHGPPRHMVA